MLADERRDGVPRRRDADVHRAGELERLLAALPACARGHGRGQPRDRHGRGRRSSPRERCDARVARRAELPAPPARRARAAGLAGRRPARRAHPARSRLRQRLARSRLRDPRPERLPTSTTTSRRLSRSSRSTSRATSSRRSRARASPSPTGRSSRARPTRWRATSSRSSTRSRPRATAGTRRRTSVSTARPATRPPRAPQPRLLARARLPRPRDRRRVDGRPASAGATCRACSRYVERSRGTSRRRARSSRSIARRTCRELLLLGLRLDEPVALADVAEAVDREALARLVALDLVELSANGRGEELRLTRRGRFLGGGVTAELLAFAAD